MIERIIEKVREIPTRPGNIGGRNYKYVRLEEVIGLLLDALDSYEAKPLPEPFTYIGPSAFEKLSSGYAMSVFCAKQAINKSDIPLYAGQPASKLLTESSQDRTKKYFSYYPEGGFELHNSAEEAKKSAEDALDTEREYACEGWSEYVDKICWGEVRQHVAETMSRPRTDADHVDSEFATIVDYGLVDIGGDNGNT